MARRAIHRGVRPRSFTPPTRREEYEAIFDAIGEGVHRIDLEGRITFVNLAAARLLGWDAGELLGREQHPTIHHTRADGTPYPAEECPILAALREGRVGRHDDELFWRKDGTALPVDYIATPIREGGAIAGLVIAFRDATERREASVRLAVEQAARLHEEQLARELQRVFMQVPAAVCTTRGPEHRIEAANPLFSAFARHADLVGRPAADVVPDVLGSAFIETMDRVYATGQPHVDTERRAAWRGDDGGEDDRFVSLVCQPLRDAANQVYGVMIHIVDVTDAARARRVIEQQAEELKRITQSLARINRELDQFAYIASHDLKAPLRGIASLAQWLAEDIGDRLGDESRKHLTLLLSRVQRMERLIDGLLQYSRAGRVRNPVETVDVDEVLAEVVEMVNAPPRVSIAIAPGMPTIQTERLPLQQVFLNLLTNAVKHSGRPDTHVTVRAREYGGFWQFTVEDDGVGIPAQYHEKVWEVFQTLQPRDKVEGAGLGLALVKKNVEGHGGRAWLESEEGHGAKFHFLWPKQADLEG